MRSLDTHALVILIVFSGMGSVLIPALEFRGILPGETARLWINSLSALITVLLVTGTLITVVQNRQDIEELRKDREKPIVRDEIKYILKPAQEALENDISDYQDNFLEWPNSHQGLLLGVTGPRFPHQVIRRNPTAHHRLKQSNRELHDRIKQRDELGRKTAELAERISETIEDDVRQYLDSNGPTPEDEEQFEAWTRTVSGAVIREIDSFGDQHPLFQFWDQNKEQLMNLLQSSSNDLYEQFKNHEREYISLSKELVQEIQDERLRLRTEFGISAEDVGQPTRTVLE